MSETLVVDEVKEIVEAESVKDRLAGAFDVMIEQADINPALEKIAVALFTNFMNSSDEQEIIELLTTMQKDLLPYILEGDNDG